METLHNLNDSNIPLSYFYLTKVKRTQQGMSKINSIKSNNVYQTNERLIQDKYKPTYII